MKFDLQKCPKSLDMVLFTLPHLSSFSLCVFKIIKPSNQQVPPGSCIYLRTWTSLPFVVEYHFFHPLLYFFPRISILFAPSQRSVPRAPSSGGLCTSACNLSSKNVRKKSTIIDNTCAFLRFISTLCPLHPLEIPSNLFFFGYALQSHRFSTILRLV